MAGVAKKVDRLREVWPSAFNVRELMPAQREGRTWYDAREETLNMSALSMFDLASWMVASGRINPPKSRIGWRGKMMQFDAWFSGGTGDLVPRMVREGVAIALGSSALSGEDRYLQNQTFDGNTDAWTGIARLAAQGKLPAIVEIEVS